MTGHFPVSYIQWPRVVRGYSPSDLAKQAGKLSIVSTDTKRTEVSFQLKTNIRSSCGFFEYAVGLLSRQLGVFLRLPELQSWRLRNVCCGVAFLTYSSSGGGRSTSSPFCRKSFRGSLNCFPENCCRAKSLSLFVKKYLFAGGLSEVSSSVLVKTGEKSCSQRTQPVLRASVCGFPLFAAWLFAFFSFPNAYLLDTEVDATQHTPTGATGRTREAR
ncbi:putative transmembrane protein [Toxoplasma gondii MAS]|uniref:Putative transmembrane protein n=1 Tax=Toxoplasma gondii MAS TaxID=943118 RepID=A0A086QQB4_TOXGO|nr:putative transmembrane protein [Toxoplasma gondii MAS]